jgi:ADP-heptose:LPS heptosyltransferase
MKYFSGIHPFHAHWKVCLFLACYNFFCFFRKKKLPPQPEKINSLLVCNWANLGDVLLATSIIPALKEHWPEAKIGFLTSPTSRVVLENHPLIYRIHIAYSWKQRALFQPLLVQIGIFLHSLIFPNDLVIKEIEKENYDLAIDLHPFFPNCSYLLSKTSIPYFLEFDSAKFHAPRSCTIDFPGKLDYLPRMYSFFLHALNISHHPLKPCFHFTNTSPLKDQEYVVFHLGTTEERREWSTHHWKTLAQKLSSEGKLIVFTGKGKREQKAIKEVSSSLYPIQFINLCDQLDWNGFVSVIKEATAVISVNTITVHLAALLDTPGVGLYLFTREPELWLPDYGSLHFLVQEGPKIYFSDPSFLKNRKNTTGLPDITPEDVFSCFKALNNRYVETSQ